MAITDQKITTAQKNSMNVKSIQGSRLTGTATENKNVFDRLVEFFIDKYNALIDEIDGDTLGGQIKATYEENTKLLNDILSDIEAEILARYTAAETDALVTQTTNPLINGFDVNLTTGVITVTFKDGTVKTWDTPLEKVPAKFEFVEEDGSYYLKVTNEDGSSTKTNVTSLMNIYSFDSTETIAINTSTSGTTTTVTATIKDASIETKHMALSMTTQFEAWVAWAREGASDAKKSATAAATSETNAADSAAAAATSAKEAKASADYLKECADSAEGFASNAAAAEGNAEKARDDAMQYASNASASMTAAQTSEANAKTSEANAKESEANAKTSETNTKESEANAKTSETNAANSATTAEAQANLAKSYADGTSGTRTGEETDNSKYYSEQAKNYATNASSSASTAANEAVSATASATAASASEANAKTSETNAASSASAAKTSETNAASSASKAAVSETNAASSASAAATSEANAKTSETNAASSASKAATSETNAKTSETNAAASASAAATSEANAATAAAELQGGIDKALAQAKASGEFNGKDGAQGEKGEDGKTPVRGTDYWTDADKAEIVEDVNNSIDLSSYAQKTELDGYLPLNGGTCTGGVIAPNFQTGDAESAYFQTKKMRGQGNANNYNHAVDWGYSGHNQVDFYEYGGIFNFHQCKGYLKSNAKLIGSIKTTGWNGGAVLTGTPTAPTAAEGTNSTQIATTEFVQKAISAYTPTVEVEILTNAEIDTIVAS